MIATHAAPKVRLYVADGKHIGESYSVRGPAFRIGRSPDCQLCTDDPQVSRHHAEIDIRGEHLFLRDLCSRNGTYLNGEPLARPKLLADGDRIQVGPLMLLVSIWSPDGSHDEDDSDVAAPAEPAVPELSPGDEAAIEELFHSMQITDSMLPDRQEKT